MTDRDRFRGAQDGNGGEQKESEERFAEQYKQFLEKLGERHPELKGVGRTRR